MSEPTLPLLSDLTAAEALQVERVCSQFESDWQEGKRPPVEERLGAFTGRVRAVLLAQLLGLELDYHRLAKEQPTLEEYLARFPADVSLVTSVFTAARNSAGTMLTGHLVQKGGPKTESLSPGTSAPGTAERARKRDEPLPTVPGYEVLSLVGEGGMGVVYKARHLKLDRIVALKMISMGGHVGGRELWRFRTEAGSIASLQHPNIVQVYEEGEHDGRLFFSLAFCPGGALDKKLNGIPLPPKEAAILVETLARAMQSAHQAMVIHCDLKPANVLLAADGSLKITDFGLARKLDDIGQTHSGAIMGTPPYMAPEQAALAEKEKQWFAVAFHLGRLLLDAPNDADLKQRRDQALRQHAVVIPNTPPPMDKAP